MKTSLEKFGGGFFSKHRGLFLILLEEAYILSSYQKALVFLLYGDEILPSYIGIMIHYKKNPVMNQSVFHSHYDGFKC